MLKTFNPRQTYTWSPESDPETVFEYRAYAGPVIPQTADPDKAMNYLVKQYLSHGIVSVTNIELPVRDREGNTTMVPFEVWNGKPEQDWTQILPSEIQNALFIKISEATRLSKTEARDLR